MEEEITYPKYLKCTNKAHFDSLNLQAAQILGTDIYQQPLIDANGDYWFLVNPEVVEVLSEEELVQSVAFDLIQLPENSL